MAAFLPGKLKSITAQGAWYPIRVPSPNRNLFGAELGAGLLRASHAGQIKKCSSIHNRPGALALVTTGPFVTTCLGIIPGPSPVFSPDIVAATPAMIAPP